MILKVGAVVIVTLAMIGALFVGLLVVDAYKRWRP